MKINEYIKQAESIFINGNSFDDERIKFINNLNTCDLLAVPGSGKTTALIAKLYCIAQNMPFEHGSGVLVLAHTNHAVDEIENKLKRHCPQLFDYPNYVGTIQSFVNKFLAIPYYIQKNQKKFRVIDDNEYRNQFDYFLKNTKGPVAYFKTKFPDLFYDSRLNLCDSGKVFVCVDNSNKEIEPKCPPKWETEKTKSNKIAEVREFIINTKCKLFSMGLLHYDDCYFYAKQYLFKLPIIKSILKNRFEFVFIDEMQDLEDYQIKLIDSIFGDVNSQTAIQRIGDINQSIYSSGKKVKVECDWKPRFPEYLNNSHRLTNEVAKLVNCFTLEPKKDLNNKPQFKVIGLHKLDSPVKPHLILFDKNTTGLELQNKFESLIKSFNLDKTDSGKKNEFKIIGWSTVWDNDKQNEDNNGNNKIRLKDLFCDYSKESKAKKEHFDCLKKYLQLFDQDKKTFEAVRKSILNALVEILRIEGIFKTTGIPYRKSSLMEFVKNISDEEYNDFKAMLFQWCFDIVVKKEFDKVYVYVKQFIEKDFINWNWANEEKVKPIFIEKSKEFVNSSNYEFQKFQTIDIKNKPEIKNPYNIKINSVHAVKGQTHCATMYVETCYRGYETKKLKVSKKATKKKPEEHLPYPLYLQEHAYRPNEDVRAKETLKMMYVGFSRPTHLLCFASLKDNIEDTTRYDNVGWQIIDLTVPTIQGVITND